MTGSLYGLSSNVYSLSNEFQTAEKSIRIPKNALNVLISGHSVRPISWIFDVFSAQNVWNSPDKDHYKDIPFSLEQFPKFCRPFYGFTWPNYGKLYLFSFSEQDEFNELLSFENLIWRYEKNLGFKILPLKFIDYENQAL